ncbi:MAG: YcxB family protein [Lachnospiraceae bacterium]|nr:YcxB family protein [Lachnospiraceae bacterium]
MDTNETVEEVLEEEAKEAGGAEEAIDDAACEVQEEKKDEGPVFEGDPLFEIDVHVTAADLFDFNLRHTYTSPMGLFSELLGILMVAVYFLKDASVLYLFFGIVVIIYLPVNLYMSAHQQSMMEAFRKPLHYAFYEGGMEVSQDENRTSMPWDQMVKAISTANCIVLYTGKRAASLFPRRDLGENTAWLIRVISAHMDPKKVKIKE